MLGGVQQPLHVDRRADGRDAAEHRLFGQHQGAARFLLRGLRPRRRAGRQRAAHAGASRLDGPLGRDDHPAERRATSSPATSLRSTRPTMAARICPTSRWCTPVFDDAAEEILFWVASRGHHADVGGTAPGSMTPLADHGRRGRRAVSTISAGRPRPLPRGETDSAAHRPSLPGPQPAPEHRRPQGADRRQREGRGRAAQDGRRISASTWSRPIWATSRTMPPRACAACSTGCTDCRVRSTRPDQAR